MKKGIILVSILTVISSFASDKDKKVLEILKGKGVKLEYVYHPEWIVLYSFNGSNRMTKANNSHNWKVPHHDCFLGPVKNIPSEKFSRSVTCDGKDLGFIECIAEEEETRCEKSFGKIDVILKIKKYPTMKTRRAIELEHELQNEIPY